MSNFKLLPKNSFLNRGLSTGQDYHVIKFYMLITPDGQTLFEATNKHKLGDCKYCKNISIKGED